MGPKLPKIDDDDTQGHGHGGPKHPKADDDDTEGHGHGGPKHPKADDDDDTEGHANLRSLR